MVEVWGVDMEEGLAGRGGGAVWGHRGKGSGVSEVGGGGAGRRKGGVGGKGESRGSGLCRSGRVLLLLVSGRLCVLMLLDSFLVSSV